MNPSRQRLQCGAAAKFSELAAACAAQAKRLRGHGVQGIHALHRIETRKTRKVSANAARSTVQSRAPPETRPARGRGQLQIAWRGGRAPNWKTSAASAQDGKAGRTAASGRFGAAALPLRHAAALRHGSTRTAGARGAALSIFRRRCMLRKSMSAPCVNGSAVRTVLPLSVRADQPARIFWDKLSHLFLETT